MRSFFKIFFASFLSLILFVVLAVIVLLVIISIAASSDKPVIETKSVLVVDLTTQIQEQRQENPLGILSGNIDENIPGLFDIVRMIEHAKTDDAISGIYIKCTDNVNGFATSEELRNALLDFKTSKKFIIAYSDFISQKGYYVANVADRVYVNPKGVVDWRGLSVDLMFLKGTLEKLDIQPQIFYAGKFKSATEPLREKQMTEPNRVQTAAFLNNMYGQLLLTTAQKTNLDTATLHNLADVAAIRTAHDAFKYKLVDGVKYDDEVKNEIISRLGIKRTDEIKFVSLNKYAKAVNYKRTGSDRIAIIYAEGEIIDGKGEDGQVGSETFKNLIRKVRLNKDIKAIVVRVNSPGGSALASDVIWRELAIARREKPVVVTMGDVAASGGYYIACAGDSIYAQPNTITGSIGVFGVVPNMKNFFNNKLGITFDGVRTGPYADMMTVTRPLTEAEKSFIQTTIDTIYHDFKNRVADGRKMSMAYVDSIAQGRVWTGISAKELKLVDRIGGMKDAIACAARMAKIKDYSLREYPEKKSFIQELLEDHEETVKVKAIKAEIGEEQYNLLKHLKSIKRMVAVPQARLPFIFEMH